MRLIQGQMTIFLLLLSNLHYVELINKEAAMRYYSDINNTEIVSQIGGSATLPCKASRSSDAAVTWIRRSDFALLTVGTTTYSSDQRFQIQYSSDAWNLIIKPVTKKDSGIYECSQQNSRSILINLTIVEATSKILEGPVKNINEGSSMSLNCMISLGTENPSFVFWYLGNKMINFDFEEGFKVLTGSDKCDHLSTQTINQDQNFKLSVNDGKNVPHFPYEHESQNHVRMQKINQEGPIVSCNVLFVSEVKLIHDGEYTCSPSNAKPSSIIVNIIRKNDTNSVESTSSSGEDLSSFIFKVSWKWKVYIVTIVIITLFHYLQETY